MAKTLEGVVEKIEEGALKGQLLATMRSGEVEVTFDLIRDVMNFKKGEKLRIHITEEKPKDLDRFDFCGHGYLVNEESQTGMTLFSIWGILFKFTPPIGLQADRKYYLCIEKA
ncbi:MAG: DNA-directed RNA polymerase subunit G [Desulfurococcales archaeon]|nr:DNA-directed RNA polymerase subunit G [Desulfurococcales archaeon]